MSAFSGDGQYGVEYGAVDILADKLQDGQKILGSDVGRYNDGLTVAGGGTGFYHNIADDKLDIVRSRGAVAQDIDPDKYTDAEKIRLRMMGMGSGNAADGTAEFAPVTSWRNEQLYRPDPENPDGPWKRGKGYELGIKDGQLYKQEVSPRDGAAIGWQSFGDDKFFRDKDKSGYKGWAEAFRRNGGMLRPSGSLEDHYQWRLQHGDGSLFSPNPEELSWKTGLTPEEWEAHMNRMNEYIKQRHGT